MARWMLFLSPHQITGYTRAEGEKNPVSSTSRLAGAAGICGSLAAAQRNLANFSHQVCGTSHEGNKEVSLQEPRSIVTTEKESTKRTRTVKHAHTHTHICTLYTCVRVCV